MKKLTKQLIGIFFVFFCLNPNLKPFTAYQAPFKKETPKEEAEWLVMVHVEARNNLSTFAKSNLEEIAMSIKNKKIHAVTQWHQPRQKGAWRYELRHGKIELENYTETKNPKDQTESLVDFVRWANKNYPAKKHCLIFWNHGTGPLNPSFGDPIRVFVNNRDVLENPRVSLNGFVQACEEESVEIVQEAALRKKNAYERGIQFDEENHCYMKNSDVTKALARITSPEILNKKINCLGYDACFMGALEIAEESTPYAEYLIASEELEMGRGWNYRSFMSKLMQKNTSPKELGTNIVNSYGDLYKGHTQFYTQSCTDLSKVHNITEKLEKIILKLSDNICTFKRPIVSAIKKARNSCVQYSTRVFIDLHSFLVTLTNKLLSEKELQNCPDMKTYTENSLYTFERKFLQQKKYAPEIIDLVETIKEGVSAIESAVVSNVCSKHLYGSKGLSIYFPPRFLDESYNDCQFHKKSSWPKFLKKFSALICH